jgi:hypothetical protein
MKFFRAVPLIALLTLALVAPALFAQKPPYEALSTLNAFPTYATCPDFERATAKPCPAWNATKPPKYWADPNPVKKLTLGGVAITLYDSFLGSRVNEEGVLESFGIAVDDAKAVNIPRTDVANVPGADVLPVPVPMRALSATQRIVQHGFGGLWQVRNTDVPESQEMADQSEVLKLLRAIAAKLGV